MAGAKLKIEAGIIPITLQTFFLCLTSLYLGRQANLLGLFIYFMLGLYLPVFSGETYGTDFYRGYTAGYIFAFPFAVILITANKKYFKDWFTTFSWLLMAHAFILLAGVAWGVFYKKLTLQYTLDIGFWGLLPGAIIKSVVASIIYWGVGKLMKEKVINKTNE